MALELKKRGRKKKEPTIKSEENIQIKLQEEETKIDKDNTVSLKKRGRKPKGGKLVIKPLEEIEEVSSLPNVILHLKCSIKDLNDYNHQISEMVKDPLTYNPSVPPDIMTYNDGKTSSFSVYQSFLHSPEENIDTNITTMTTNNNIDTIVNTNPIKDPYCYAYTDFVCKRCNIDTKTTDINNRNEPLGDYDDVNIKDVNSKLKKLKIQYFKNILQDKKSSCFWCTYEFDNETCYIPKYDLDGTVCGYGSFCRPECAVAYLMKENIDDSTKFKRYEMLNRIYSKVYDYKKNIKPAADPYYLLEKFYGSLTIKEYRKLSKSEHMLLIIDKPMTRILPELHEDNDEFILNIYGGVKNTQNNVQSGVYKVKRQSEKNQGPTKNSIIQKKFGVST